MKTNKTSDQPKRIGGRLTGDNRIIDLLEHLGAVILYTNTPLGQTEVAKILGMDNNRVNEILKGVKKSNRSK